MKIDPCFMIEMIAVKIFFLNKEKSTKRRQDVNDLDITNERLIEFSSAFVQSECFIAPFSQISFRTVHKNRSKVLARPLPHKVYIHKKWSNEHFRTDFLSLWPFEHSSWTFASFLFSVLAFRKTVSDIRSSFCQCFGRYGDKLHTAQLLFGR